MPKKIRAALVKQLLLVVLLGFSFTSASSTFGPLIEQLDALVKTNVLPSYSLAIVNSDKKLLIHAAGMRDRQAESAANVDTMYRIGSITKTFTAMALLQLQASGAVDLTQPLSRYLNDVRILNPWQRTHPITIEQLLEHSAGLLDLDKSEFDYPAAQGLTLKQALALNKTRTVEWQPGLFHSYSNAGYGYAGYAIEVVSKMKYEAYITENIFKPLAMNASSLRLDSATKTKLATGYDRDGIKVIPYWHMLYRPFGAINSTASDMANFVIMLLNRGRFQSRAVLPEQAIKRMESVKTTLAARSGLGYGYGFGLYSYYRNGVLFYGHGGDADGYLARFGYSRSLGQGYFLAINIFDYDALNRVQRIIEGFLTQAVKQASTPEARISRHMVKPLLGYYSKTTRRFPWQERPKRNQHTLQITWQQGQLYKQIGSQPRLRLRPLGKYTFADGNEPGASSVFAYYNNRWYYLCEQGNFIQDVRSPGITKSNSIHDHKKLEVTLN